MDVFLLVMSATSTLPHALGRSSAERSRLLHVVCPDYDHDDHDDDHHDDRI